MACDRKITLPEEACVRERAVARPGEARRCEEKIQQLQGAHKASRSMAAE